MFDYTKKRALVVAVSIYDKLRQIEKLENAVDLPETIELDLEVAKAGLARMHFTEDEITTVEEPSFDRLKEVFGELATEARDNHKNGHKTFFYIAYMGRGICDMTANVQALLNEPKVFPIEVYARHLSRM